MAKTYLFPDACQSGGDCGSASGALKRYVARHRHATVTEALNRVYATESSELDPIIAAIQAASLPRENW